jgi:ATPase subunit of ABC transporter with duplicated ATPase domains
MVWWSRGKSARLLSTRTRRPIEGTTIFTLQDVTKRIEDDGRLLFEHVSLQLLAGSKTGVIGVNGA